MSLKPGEIKKLRPENMSHPSIDIDTRASRSFATGRFVVASPARGKLRDSAALVTRDWRVKKPGMTCVMPGLSEIRCSRLVVSDQSVWTSFNLLEFVPGTGCEGRMKSLTASDLTLAHQLVQDWNGPESQPMASTVATLGWERHSKHDFEDVFSFLPEYYRSSDAEEKSADSP
jgi:hypothetical protein